jgi:hypothetical protein
VCRPGDGPGQPQSCRQALGKRVADGGAEQGVVTALCDVDQAALDGGDRDVIPEAPFVRFQIRVVDAYPSLPSFREAPAPQ